MKYKLSVLATLLLATPTSLLAATTPTPQYPEVTEQLFAQCKADFALLAKQQGVTDDTITRALLPASLQAKVIEYDRNQPEFVRTFPDYVSKRVNDWRINKGREMLKEHSALLQSLNQRYGIPAHYLVAFWGLETNFGQYKGKMPIVASLATLACDERRSEFFTKELLKALQLIEKERIDPEQMVGSWAGAMGHTQFMPSAYLNYAIDGDNDGKADLWNSVPDALTSAANFLQGLGWKPGFRWGREVKLPDNFDYQLIGRSTKKSLTEWQGLGLTKADGSPLGAAEIKASVLLPAGHEGPAFVIYDNFSVIMRWNFSEFYAIAVGYLADRLIGSGELVQPLPELPTYTIADMRTLQVNLNQLGFDVGEPDGILGPATRNGIQGFQVAHKLVADGFPSLRVFEKLQQLTGETSTN
ncbi:lytic murein transglycosylase [Planctobacterium marinum]|uniref:lytic murein transglycosylase n=1 Tax=Planctobacterium marinum TaxID=1631968 RepID=UPI001E5A64DD|nr:lytic murein transglycosylase [Planctobacterium marinum]MCC2605831.1 lytic murein transglycosylase [Planctobacterium marinum]